MTNFYNYSNKSILFFLTCLLCISVSKGNAQIIWSNPSGGAWLTGSNWTGGVVPTATDVAQFNINPTSATTGVGIDMGVASGALSVGAIYLSPARTANLIVGNSSATPGLLTLTGGIVNGTANTILANLASNAAVRLNLQNTQGTGNSTMGINMGTGAKNILTGSATTATGAGNTISIANNISGAAALTLLGGGTWNAATSTGFTGGILRLAGNNTATGGITVGASDGTASGILQLDSTAAISNSTGNDITINSNSQLYLATTAGSTYALSNILLHLNGNGNNYASTGKGALVNLSSASYTWTGNIDLASDAGISVIGAATTALTLTSNITGTGRLIKNGIGNLVLNGAGNWTGGTEVTNGKVTVNAGAGISNGALVMAQTANSPSIVFNNAAQTVSGLSSSFTGTSAANTITLTDTRLTIVQNSNTVYGGATATLLSTVTGTGSIVKTGTGRLTLTSPANTFSGGLKISAGEIRYNPASLAAITNTSPDTLDGGTMSTAGISRTFTFTMGTLALTENSTIDLGTDTLHSIKFANSSAINWSAGKTLTITNWTGGWNGLAGTKGRIYIGTTATGATTAQLAQIKFVDGSGNIFAATQLSTGEVVPAASTITTTPATYGAFCNNIDNFISVSFTTTGPITGTYYVQLSSPGGVFTNDFTTNIIGSGTSSPITATIPMGTPAGTGYKIRVINASPVSVFGTNNGSNIVVNGTPVLPAITGSPIVPLGGTITLSNATTGGTYTSDNTAVASVNPTTGAVTGLSVGTANITYSYTNFCGFTGTTSTTITVVAIPAITSITPNTGNLGTIVTITGTNFNTIASNDIVYFGAVKASVTAASATSITVTVPVNASYAPVTLTDTTTGLTASAQYAFVPTYNNTGLFADSVNFKLPVDFTTGAVPVGVGLGDLDGDGKPDMVVINSGPNNMYVYHNTSVNGTIDASSFATPVTYATLFGPHYVRIADLDGDGKPEVIVTNTATSSNKISVYKNTSTTGNISFAARVDFSAVAAPIDLSIADMDGDGKPEIAIILQNSNKVSILRNNTTTGVINTASFTGGLVFNTGVFPFKIYTGDLDNDGKADIALTNYLSNSITVLHNSATLGNLNTTSFATATTILTGIAPTGIAGGDIDGDGKPDLVVTNTGDNTISVYRNANTVSGTLSFAPAITYATDSIPEDVALADADGDGKLDIAVGNFGSDNVSIFHNNAVVGTLNTASLAARKNFATGSQPAGMAFTDIDSDGKPDLAVVNGNASSVSILKNYPLPRIGVTVGNDSICVGTSTTLTNSVAGGTWVSRQPAIATVSNTGVVHGIAPGTDTILYYTIAQGDTNTASFIITIESPATVGAVMAVRTAVCTGAKILLTNATVGGTWTSSNTGIATVDTAGFVSGVTTGSAIITYAINSSCGSSSDTILITVTPGTGYVIGAISGATTLCAGSNATLTDTSAGGSWTSGNTAVATISNTGMVHAIAYGNAIITYAINTACGIYQATHVVAVDSALVADSVYGPSSVCVGAAITLTDAAGIGGTWTLSNANATVTAGGVLTGVNAGSVTVSYTIGNICGTDIGTKTITVRPLPVAGTITGPATVCPADSVTFSSTATGGIWSVTNSNAIVLASNKIKGVTAGTDTVRYIVTNGCGADTATKELTILPLPNAGIISGLSVVCPGASITLRDTVAGGVWSSLNSNATVSDSIVTGVTPGTDTIRYTVTTTCGTAVAIKKITINAVTPVAPILGPSTVCTGASITLTNATDSGTWSKTNTRANVSATGVVTGLSAGIDTIKYTPKGTCPIVAAKEITVNGTPNAGPITGAATVCVGASITLRDTVMGGVWSGTNVNSLLTDSILTGIRAGIDTVRYTITSECGLTSAIKRITVNPLPYADEIIGSTSLYVGDIITLKDSISGGVWGLTGTNALISANGRLGGLKAGVDTVKYSVTNSCGTAIARLPITILSSSSPGSIADIQLYPNPNNGKFSVKLLSLIDESVSVVISNMAYQVINVIPMNTNVTTDMDFGLADGVYFLSAVSQKGWFTVRFVIAK